MKYRFIVILLSVSLHICAQNPEEWYNSFKQQALKEYSDFREKANAEYADFLRAAWEYYKVSPAGQSQAACGL